MTVGETIKKVRTINSINDNLYEQISDQDIKNISLSKADARAIYDALEYLINIINSQEVDPMGK